MQSFETIQAKDETRDSWIRNVSNVFVEPIAKRLVKKFPSLSPDYVTLSGLALVGAGSYLCVREQLSGVSNDERKFNLNKLGSVLVSMGYACDGGDGLIARIRKNLLGVEMSNYGGTLDTVVDRFENAMVDFALVLQSDGRIARNVALARMISNLLPSLTRNLDEGAQKKAPETGTDSLSIWGTQIMRAMSGTAGLAIPKGSKYMNILTIAGNLKSSYDRARILYDPNSEMISNTKKEEALRKRPWLYAAAGIVTSAAVGAYVLRNTNIK